MLRSVTPLCVCLLLAVISRRSTNAFSAPSCCSTPGRRARSKFFAKQEACFHRCPFSPTPDHSHGNLHDRLVLSQSKSSNADEDADRLGSSMMETDDSTLEKIKSLGVNFKDGLLETHNNYLHLWKQIIKLELVIVLPVLMLFLLGYAYNLAPVTTDLIRSKMEAMLLFLGYGANNIASIPFQLFNTLCKGRRPRFISSESQHQGGVVVRTKLPFWWLVTVGPFIEELIFRAFLQDGIKQIGKILARLQPLSRKTSRNSLQSNSTDAVGKKKEDRHPIAWVIVSLIFASIHFTNHLPSPNAAQRDEIVVEALKNAKKEAGQLGKPLAERFVRLGVSYIPLLKALFQGVLCFATSMCLYCPLYEKRGLMASTGAHVFWNVQAQAFPSLSIPVRLVVALWRKKHRDTNKGGSGGRDMEAK